MHAATSLDPRLIETVALAVRRDVCPGIHEAEPLPIAPLARKRTRVAGRLVTLRGLEHLPEHVWAVTDIGRDRARIWLHRTAWAELPLDVPRTRFSVAHELAHVALHAEALSGDLAALPDGLEPEADRAAAHILIPDRALDMIARKATLGADTLASRFGVSMTTATRRIQEWRNSL